MARSRRKESGLLFLALLCSCIAMKLDDFSGSQLTYHTDGSYTVNGELTKLRPFQNVVKLRTIHSSPEPEVSLEKSERDNEGDGQNHKSSQAKCSNGESEKEISKGIAKDISADNHEKDYSPSSKYEQLEAEIDELKSPHSSFYAEANLDDEENAEGRASCKILGNPEEAVKGLRILTHSEEPHRSYEKEVGRHMDEYDKISNTDATVFTDFLESGLVDLHHQLVLEDLLKRNPQDNADSSIHYRENYSTRPGSSIRGYESSRDLDEEERHKNKRKLNFNPEYAFQQKPELTRHHTSNAKSLLRKYAKNPRMTGTRNKVSLSDHATDAYHRGNKQVNCNSNKKEAAQMKSRTEEVSFIHNNAQQKQEDKKKNGGMSSTIIRRSEITFPIVAEESYRPVQNHQSLPRLQPNSPDDLNSKQSLHNKQYGYPKKMSSPYTKRGAFRKYGAAKSPVFHKESSSPLKYMYAKKPNKVLQLYSDTRHGYSVVPNTYRKNREGPEDTLHATILATSGDDPGTSRKSEDKIYETEIFDDGLNNEMYAEVVHCPSSRGANLCRKSEKPTQESLLQRGPVAVTDAMEEEDKIGPGVIFRKGSTRGQRDNFREVPGYAVAEDNVFASTLSHDIAYAAVLFPHDPTQQASRDRESSDLQQDSQNLYSEPSENNIEGRTEEEFDLAVKQRSEDVRQRAKRDNGHQNLPEKGRNIHPFRGPFETYNNHKIRIPTRQGYRGNAQKHLEADSGQTQVICNDNCLGQSNDDRYTFPFQHHAQKQHYDQIGISEYSSCINNKGEKTYGHTHGDTNCKYNRPVDEEHSNKHYKVSKGYEQSKENSYSDYIHHGENEGSRGQRNQNKQPHFHHHGAIYDEPVTHIEDYITNGHFRHHHQPFSHTDEHMDGKVSVLISRTNNQHGKQLKYYSSEGQTWSRPNDISMQNELHEHKPYQYPMHPISTKYLSANAPSYQDVSDINNGFNSHPGPEHHHSTLCSDECKHDNNVTDKERPKSPQMELEIQKHKVQTHGVKSINSVRTKDHRNGNTQPYVKFDGPCDGILEHDNCFSKRSESRDLDDHRVGPQHILPSEPESCSNEKDAIGPVKVCESLGENQEVEIASEESVYPASQQQENIQVPNVSNYNVESVTAIHEPDSTAESSFSSRSVSCSADPPEADQSKVAKNQETLIITPKQESTVSTCAEVDSYKTGIVPSSFREEKANTDITAVNGNEFLNLVSKIVNERTNVQSRKVVIYKQQEVKESETGATRLKLEKQSFTIRFTLAGTQTSDSAKALQEKELKSRSAMSIDGLSYEEANKTYEEGDKITKTCAKPDTWENQMERERQHPQNTNDTLDRKLNVKENKSSTTTTENNAQSRTGVKKLQVGSPKVKSKQKKRKDESIFLSLDKDKQKVSSSHEKKNDSDNKPGHSKHTKKSQGLSSTSKNEKVNRKKVTVTSQTPQRENSSSVQTSLSLPNHGFSNQAGKNPTDAEKTDKPSGHVLNHLDDDETDEPNTNSADNKSKKGSTDVNQITNDGHRGKSKDKSSPKQNLKKKTKKQEGSAEKKEDYEVSHLNGEKNLQDKQNNDAEDDEIFDETPAKHYDSYKHFGEYPQSNVILNKPHPDYSKYDQGTYGHEYSKSFPHQQPMHHKYPPESHYRPPFQSHKPNVGMDHRYQTNSKQRENYGGKPPMLGQGVNQIRPPYKQGAMTAGQCNQNNNYGISHEIHHVLTKQPPYLMPRIHDAHF